MEEAQKLQQLKEISNVDDEDILMAVLTDNDWDLEASIRVLTEHASAFTPLIPDTAQHSAPAHRTMVSYMMTPIFMGFDLVLSLLKYVCNKFGFFPH